MREDGLNAYLAAIDAGKASQVGDPDRADFTRKPWPRRSGNPPTSTSRTRPSKRASRSMTLLPRLFRTSTNRRSRSSRSNTSRCRTSAKKRSSRPRRWSSPRQQAAGAAGSHPAPPGDRFLQRSVRPHRGEGGKRSRPRQFPRHRSREPGAPHLAEDQQVIVLQESRKKMAQDSPSMRRSRLRSARSSRSCASSRSATLRIRPAADRDLLRGDGQPLPRGALFRGTARPHQPGSRGLQGSGGHGARQDRDARGRSGKVQSARERFRRIIASDSEDSKPLKAQAYLNLADLHMISKEWKDAFGALDTINKDKTLFAKDRAKRAEALFKLGVVLDEMDDPPVPTRPTRGRLDLRGLQRLGDPGLGALHPEQPQGHRGDGAE